MTQVLPKLPLIAPLELKALASLARRPGEAATIPLLAVAVSGVRADRARVAAYREVCGFAPSAFLPVTYPQVQAIALHLWLMTHPDFPFPLLGLVHLRNRTEQFQPLREDASFEIRASLGPGRRIPGALIFDLVTEHFDASGQLCSKAVTTPLVRLKTDTPRAKMPEAQLPPMSVLETFHVPGNIGRRYARVSNDINPIHLSALTARLFGFKQAIAHGMWSVARCAAALERARSTPTALLNVQYRAPLLLPADVALKHAATDNGTEFALHARDGEKLYLNGQLR